MIAVSAQSRKLQTLSLSEGGVWGGDYMSTVLSLMLRLGCVLLVADGQLRRSPLYSKHDCLLLNNGTFNNAT